MNDNSEQIKRTALNILRSHPEGLTIRSLSEIIGVHRQTVTKYIFELKGSGIIYRRRVGSATLLYLREKYPGGLEEEW